jgi:hypothetical protein
MRKLAVGEISGQDAFAGSAGAKKAAQECFRLQGLHGKYALHRWASKCGVARSTLQDNVDKISEEERAGLRMVGILERQRGLDETALLLQEEIWEKTLRAAAKQQVGQDALYLDSGVSFSIYAEAHKWGVELVVSAMMTPTEASQAIVEKFSAKIGPDTLLKTAGGCT